MKNFLLTLSNVAPEELMMHSPKIVFFLVVATFITVAGCGGGAKQAATDARPTTFTGDAKWGCFISRAQKNALFC